MPHVLFADIRYPTPSRDCANQSPSAVCAVGCTQLGDLLSPPAWSHPSFPTVTPISMSPQNTMLQSQVPNPSAAFPPPHTSGGRGVLNLTAGGGEGPVKEVGHVIWNPCTIWLFQNQTTTGVPSPEKLSVSGAEPPLRNKGWSGGIQSSCLMVMIWLCYF